MTAEIDILGVYVPALLAWGVLALVLSGLLRQGFTRLGLYRHLWHPPLFDAAVFVLLLGGVVAAANWIAPYWIAP